MRKVNPVRLFGSVNRVGQYFCNYCLPYGTELYRYEGITCPHTCSSCGKVIDGMDDEQRAAAVLDALGNPALDILALQAHQAAREAFLDDNDYLIDQAAALAEMFDPELW